MLAGAPLLAVAVALGVGALFVLVAAQSPASAYSALIDVSVGSVAALAQSLTTAVPVILTGIGMGLAFRVGLFNLGGEGQMIFGALATAVTGHALAGLPGALDLVAAVLAGALAGAAWALLPAWWEAWFRVPLVVTTLLPGCSRPTSRSIRCATRAAARRSPRPRRCRARWTCRS